MSLGLAQLHFTWYNRATSCSHRTFYGVVSVHAAGTCSLDDSHLPKWPRSACFRHSRMCALRLATASCFICRCIQFVCFGTVVVWADQLHMHHCASHTGSPYRLPDHLSSCDSLTVFKRTGSSTDVGHTPPCRVHQVHVARQGGAHKAARHALRIAAGADAAG